MTTKKSYKLAALLLALVLALSACAGKQENKSADPAGSGQTNAQSAKPGAEAETGTRSPEEPGTEPAEDPVRTDPQTPADFGTQAAAVAEQYCDWSDTLEQYMYPTAALTDLDQNGRLELIIASCEGSGLFTYSNFRELDEDLKLQPLSFL